MSETQFKEIDGERYPIPAMDKVFPLAGSCALKAALYAWKIFRNSLPCRVLSFRRTRDDDHKGVRHAVLVFWTPDGTACGYDCNRAGGGTLFLGKYGPETNPSWLAEFFDPSARSARWVSGLAAPKVDRTQSLKAYAEKLNTLNVNYAEKLKAESEKFFSGLAEKLDDAEDEQLQDLLPADIYESYVALDPFDPSSFPPEFQDRAQELFDNWHDADEADEAGIEDQMEQLAQEAEDSILQGALNELG